MPDISQVNVGGIVYDVKDQAARTGKQDAITAIGLLKGNGSSVAAAEAGVDYAPAYSPIGTLTANTTLTSTHFGKYMMASSASAITVTLPTVTADMAGAEMELHNIGTGNVTLTGALRLGGTASASKSVILKTGDAVTVKCIGTGSGAWTVIGSYTEV